MSIYMLPHFGEINPAALKDYYDATIEFQGREVDLDMSFDNKTIDAARLEIVKQFIDNLVNFDLKNKQYIDQDFEDSDRDTVAFYVRHHLEEMDEDVLVEVIDPGNKSISSEKQLINVLHLVRIGFYPDSNKGFVVFDYTLGRELTDDLVVIIINENGELDRITMES